MGFQLSGRDEQRLKGVHPDLVAVVRRAAAMSDQRFVVLEGLRTVERQKELVAELEKYDWSGGAGPRLKQILTRGVGVHHAGVLPKYKRVVEDLFQQKLLSVCVCTETLAAGMNLPARSVVLTTLLKGPPRKKKIIESSSAHQMFGRAGRPQFDTEGHVYALAHDDDVKIARWKQKHDLESLEKSPDPNLRAAAKRLKKKMPTRRTNEQYWNEEQFAKLIEAPPGKLVSRGHLPWRLLAYLLTLSPEVERVRAVIRKRLLTSDKVEANVKQLTRMLTTLWAGGFVTLDPPPPIAKGKSSSSGEASDDTLENASPEAGTFGALLQQARRDAVPGKSGRASAALSNQSMDRDAETDSGPTAYEPQFATPTKKLQELFAFRAINPVYGSFLLRHLGRADREEWLQVFESVLEVPGSMVRMLRVPPPDLLPPGPLAKDFLDQEIVTRGLIPAGDLYPDRNDEQVREEKKFAPTIAEKLLILFRHEFPSVSDLPVRAVRSASDLIGFGGDFNGYVTGRGLTKQEGILFRHFLRLILLCGEFRAVTPDGRDPAEWQADLLEVERTLTSACRGVDPHSTDYVLEHATEGDIVEADAPPQEISPEQIDEEFGEGLGGG